MFKVTKQFARDKTETPFAEFDKQEEAELFLRKKSEEDGRLNVKIIYRLFNNNKLLHEFNKEAIDPKFAQSEYANGDKFFPAVLPNAFKVAERDQKSHFIATFNNLNEANFFIEEKLQSNASASLNTNVVYCLYEQDQLIKEFKQSESNESTTQSAGSQGTSSAATLTFSPTPLNMALRPGPAKWVRDAVEDEKDKKK